MSVRRLRFAGAAPSPGDTPPERLDYSGKIVRLAQRLRDPQWRRYGALLFAGKALGIAAVLGIMVFAAGLFGGRAYADDPVVKANDIVNPLNTLWVLLAAFLVFAMQTGFTMLEAGFCRSRETVNVLMECIVDTCLCGLLFWAWGFAFMFGHGNGFIGWGDGNGHSWFFLNNIPDTYEGYGVATIAYWLFQFAFADTCSTITSGAMIGRTGWIGDLVYSFFVSGFIYPIVGHWAWGPDGFLLTFMGGFHDFAGSTVVHTVGGMIALAGAIVLGPRLGRRFKRDGGGPMLPHDLVIAAAGGLILWFGWYGFNPGSTLSAMDFIGCGRVATNTTLAACAGGLTAMFYGFPQTKKWDLGFTVNGFLAGLVAITCPCYWVSPLGAVVIGGIAGVIVVAAINLMEWLRIDDPIGAVPVHGICGIWGTISLGFFACGKYYAAGTTGATPIDKDHAALAGVFYGGGVQLLIAQVLGNLIMGVAAFAFAMVVMLGCRAAGILRVSNAGEAEGLDLHEHGIPAYPEYQLIPSAVPHGASHGSPTPSLMDAVPTGSGAMSGTGTQ